MIALQLVGTDGVSRSITCISHILPILGGFALGMVWLRHYLARTAGGTVAARVIGVLLSVPVGNLAARIFTGSYPNLVGDGQAENVLLIVFIGMCLAICLALITEMPKPAAKPSTGQPTQPSPRTGAPHGNH